jgi:hypothetical protein
VKRRSRAWVKRGSGVLFWCFLLKEPGVLRAIIIFKPCFEELIYLTTVPSRYLCPFENQTP